MKKIARKTWAKFESKLDCARMILDDLLLYYHDPQYKDKLTALLAQIVDTQNEAFDNSLTDKKYKEFYGCKKGKKTSITF